MRFVDISTDTKNAYALDKNEKCVFYMLNRSGELTFELSGTGAKAHIFAFFMGQGDDQATLRITQRHLAPDTVSSALVKSVLSDGSSFTYEGLIRIAKQARRSDASQESRSLLLSRNARAFAKPALEILADDVRCRHAATTSSLDKEQLFFAASRGLSEEQAKRLLVDGFLNEAIEKMERIMNTELGIKKKFKTNLSQFMIHNS